MITHEIQVIIPTTTQHGNHSNWPYPPQGMRKVPDKMSKLEYTQYIESLPFKRGSIIFSSYGNQIPPNEVIPDRMYIVEDIQELHYVVDYSTDGIPRCLYLKGLKTPKVQGFYSSPSTWVLLKYDEISDEAKKYVDTRNNSSSTN